MKPKEVQKKLNILFPGVGDEWIRNYDKKYYDHTDHFTPLSRAVLVGLQWQDKSTYDFWSEIFDILIELVIHEAI